MVGVELVASMSSQSLSQQPVSNASKHRIGFVGERDVGKTTVATLVADRLSDRTQVTVLGEAAGIVGSESAQQPNVSPELEIEWTVVDANAGSESFERWADSLDTAFVVATPDTLDTVSTYERIANRADINLFLIVTRFTEAYRERLRAFDGPELAEYFYEDAAITTAMDAGEIPALEDWTVEAILIEALQPERLDPDTAIDALETRQQSIVNVEVTGRQQADALIDTFESAGYRAAYYRCNCRCHDGHVIARLHEEG